MPSLESVLTTWWGSAPQGNWWAGVEWAASNIITGTNPPFTVTDFLAQYPNFGGIPTVIPNVTITQNQNTLTGLNVPSGTTLAAGQLIVGQGIPGGALISSAPVSVVTTNVTLSALATASGTPTLTFYAPSVQLVNCETTLNSNVITGFVVPAGASLSVGQQVTGAFIPAGATISSIVSATEITLSQNATFSGATTLTVFAPLASIAGTVTAGSAVVTNMTVPSGVTIAPNQLVSGTGIPASAIVSSVATQTSSAITMTGLATQSGSITLTIYTAPFVPILVLLIYVQLANACIFQARYQELWPLAMALFIGHYATMWLMSQGNPTTTAGQVAAAGLQTGILTSQSVDGVSAGYTNALVDFEWGGNLQLTSFGASLLSIAGAIPKFVYAW